MGDIAEDYSFGGANAFPDPKDEPTSPIEAEKELNRIFQNIPYGDYWGEDEENEAKAALLAWRHKAVLKAELKARTDTMRIYNKSLKEDGAKDE